MAATTRSLGFPERIEVIPNADQTQFRFRLFLRQSAEPTLPAVEFDLAPDDLVHLMQGLQHLQARHQIPMPPIPRSPGGRPVLRVVAAPETEDET